MGAPLILSFNIRNMSTYQRASYVSPEAVAINQDELGAVGMRLQGDN